MKPSVGRIVHYHKTPESDPLPMLITHVHSDTSVSGVAFSAFSMNGVDRTNAIRSCAQSADLAFPHCWRWPPRV